MQQTVHHKMDYPTFHSFLPVYCASELLLVRWLQFLPFCIDGLRNSANFQFTPWHLEILHHIHMKIGGTFLLWHRNSLRLNKYTTAVGKRHLNSHCTHLRRLFCLASYQNLRRYNLHFSPHFRDITHAWSLWTITLLSRFESLWFDLMSWLLDDAAIDIDIDNDAVSDIDCFFWIGTGWKPTMHYWKAVFELLYTNNVARQLLLVFNMGNDWIEVANSTDALSEALI